MQYLRKILCLACFFISVVSFSQHQISIHGELFELEENVENGRWMQILNSQISFDGQIYAILCLEEYPSKERFEEMQSNQIILEDFLADRCYTALLPQLISEADLTRHKISAVHMMEREWRLNPDVWNGNYSDELIRGDQLKLLMRYPTYFSQERIIQAFANVNGVEIQQHNGIDPIIALWANLDAIDKIIELPYLAYLDLHPEHGTPDDTPGRSLHRANLVDSYYAGGMKYTGDGVSVLCRDDGAVGPHIDFHGRIDQSFSGGSRGSHGDGVSGIMSGCGNLDPRNRGMAAGSFLYVNDYDASFLDETMMLHLDHDVLITNSSYSNGCNQGYTTSTVTVDIQCHDNPSLIHVFSAGNSNGLNCGYGAGDQWGNITGGHKQGKNVLTTANLFFNATLVGSSSRGPAHDGRIKPDIAANGEDQISTDPDHSYSPFGGTSGAAPGVAGVMAQLHEAYRINYGEIADAALLKAILLNAANDLGNKGPDFRYGWGHLNAYRAARIVEQDRFSRHSIEAGGIEQIEFEIPFNVKEAKIMVYWADPASFEGSSKALINNLDALITDGSGETHSPWVLDPTPDTETLNLPATKGYDDLNNMEQIQITDPAAGNYTLEVVGTTVPFGSRDFFVVYEYLYNEIEVIYPVGGESIVPGQNEVIHWETSTEDSGEFLIEYSLDGGMSWLELSTAPAQARLAQVSFPDEYSAEAKVRVSRENWVGQSVANFNIVPFAPTPELSRVCPESIEINWPKVEGAESYNLYVLGERYMDLYSTVTDTFATLPFSAGLDVTYWVAVDVVLASGAQSRRSIAKQIGASELKNCVQDYDMRMDSIANWVGVESSCDLSYQKDVIIGFYNDGANDVNETVVAYQVNDWSIVYDTITDVITSKAFYEHVFTQPILFTEKGEYQIRSWVSVDNETAMFNDTLTQEFAVYLGPGEAIPFTEDFDESEDFPLFWYTENPGENVTWDIRGTIGSDDEQTRSLYIANWLNSSGDIDYFYMPPLDLSSASEDLHLLFDFAYAPMVNFEDTLRVEVSTNCGQSFEHVIFERSGYDLQTTISGGFFVPFNFNQWQRLGASLSDFIGTEHVIIRFVSVSEQGNNMYIDNINIRNHTIFAPIANFIVTEDRPCKNEGIEVFSFSGGDFLTYNWDWDEFSVAQSEQGVGPHALLYFVEGPKTIQLEVSNSLGSDVMTRDIEVIFFPENGFTYVNQGSNTVAFTANEPSGPDKTYSWDFGDGNMSSMANPVHTYMAPGTYVVELEVSNKCTNLMQAQNVIATSSSTEESAIEEQIYIYPQPARENVWIDWSSTEIQTEEVRFRDMAGRLLQVQELNNNSGSVEIPIGHLPAGMYMLELKGEGASYYKKLIKE